MSNVAFTVFQNDAIGLYLWLSYYSKHFENLHLLCMHTRDDVFVELDNLKSFFDFTYEKLENVCDAATATGPIKNKQRQLLETNEWVLYTNMDEIVVYDPVKYDSFNDLVTKQNREWIACEGFEVIRVDGEDRIDYSKPILNQRKYWIKNPNYNKIIFSKVPLDWNDGQHQISGVTGEVSLAFKDTGLYLIHLKYMDPHGIGRDLGPIMTSNQSYVSDRFEDKTLIPDIIKTVI